MSLAIDGKVDTSHAVLVIPIAPMISAQAAVPGRREYAMKKTLAASA